MRRVQIGGTGSLGNEDRAHIHTLAHTVGKYIAQTGAVYVFGSEGNDDHLPDVIYKGVQEEKGSAVAILRDREKLYHDDENTIVMPSGMVRGSGWEALIALSCDVLFVIGGGAGTLQEMTVAYQAGIPIVALTGTGGWADKLADSYLDYREKYKVISESDPKKAVEIAYDIGLKKISSK